MKQLVERHFNIVPPRKLPPEAIAEINTPSFIGSYIKIPEEQALALEEPDNFYRLCGLEHILYVDLSKENLNGEFNTYTSNYFETRSKIVEQNFYLVRYMANRCSKPNLSEYDELFSEAMFALLNSVDRFNPWMGCKFSTYACNSISKRFSQKLKQISRKRHFPLNNLDLSYNQDEESFDNVAERASSLMQEEGVLSQREKEVLELGFFTNTGLTKLKDVANFFGVSRQRVYQIKKRAFKKLRSRLVYEFPSLALAE